MTATAIMASAGLGTPETYLDTQPRQQNFASKLSAGNHDYPGASSLSLNEFALKGPWNASQESITVDGAGASISGAVQAAHVYLVMTSAGNVPRQGRVLLDGQPIPNAHAGADVKNGASDRDRPAAVLAGLVPDRRTVHVHGAVAARRQRLRLHVRLISVSSNRRAVEHRRGLEQVVGRVDVEQLLWVLDLEQNRIDRGDHVLHRTVPGTRL